MLHTGIFGPTMSGKTTLAMSLCRSFEKRGIKCIVLDPYNAEWNATFQTRDINEFLRVAVKSRNCALFADEAGRLDLRNPHHEWILTGSRHWGHVAHIIGQTGIHLSPAGRAQITRLYLFRASEQTAAYWHQIFIDDKIWESLKLNQYEFIHAQMFGGVTKHKLEL